MIRSYLFTMLPAVLAFAFSGVYAIVDGFFVGQYIGDSGLAGINIAYPMTALLQAVGTGIGMGGSIHMSISLGRGKMTSASGFWVRQSPCCCLRRLRCC